MHHKKHKEAFTLVELIIVITILAILATIAFVSFQGYIKQSKDSQTLSSLNGIQKGLDIYQVQTGIYPDPDNMKEVSYSGNTISLQGEIGEGVVTKVKSFTKVYKTGNGESFKYSISKSKEKYVVGGKNTDNKMYLVGTTGTGKIDSQVITIPSLVNTSISGVDKTQTGKIILPACTDSTCGGIFIENEAEVKSDKSTQSKSGTTITGTCGSNNLQALMEAPTSNLCLAGASSGIITTSTGWTWSCKGDTTVNCSASKSSLFNGLVAWYDFNGNTKDKSGLGRDLTNYNAISTSDESYYFNGASYMVGGSWFNYQEYTISFWVKQTGLNGSWMSLIDNNHYNSSNWVVQSNNSTNYGFGPVPSAFTLTMGQWHQVSISKSNANFYTVYLDGNITSSGSYGSHSYNGSQTLNIGRAQGFGRYFIGNIDEFRVYNRVLDSIEVNSIKSYGTPVNGQCGTSNGKDLLTAPAINLCSAGNTGSVNLNGSNFNWSCSGKGGGNDASCSANKLNMSDYTLSGTLTTGLVYIKNSDLSQLRVNSCNEYLNLYLLNSDGVYYINPTGTSSFKAYCDMTTDGGGWTLVSRIGLDRNHEQSGNYLWSSGDITTNGKYADTIINSLKSGVASTDYAFRFSCGGISKYFPGNCTFNADYTTGFPISSNCAKFSDTYGGTWNTSVISDNCLYASYYLGLSSMTQGSACTALSGIAYYRRDWRGTSYDQGCLLQSNTYSTGTLYVR